jgi:hypothetical protein
MPEISKIPCYFLCCQGIEADAAKAKGAIAQAYYADGLADYAYANPPYG